VVNDLISDSDNDPNNNSLGSSTYVRADSIQLMVPEHPWCALGRDLQSSYLRYYNVLAILSLGCSVTSVASIIFMFIFFTYAILAGLHYSYRE
jgi:hypothetical protein